jgi:hypothetical protein
VNEYNGIFDAMKLWHRCHNFETEQAAKEVLENHAKPNETFHAIVTIHD